MNQIPNQTLSSPSHCQSCPSSSLWITVTTLPLPKGASGRFYSLPSSAFGLDVVPDSSASKLIHRRRSPKVIFLTTASAMLPFVHHEKALWEIEVTTRRPSLTHRCFLLQPHHRERQRLPPAIMVRSGLWCTIGRLAFFFLFQTFTWLVAENLSFGFCIFPFLDFLKCICWFILVVDVWLKSIKIEFNYWDWFNLIDVVWLKWSLDLRIEKLRYELCESVFCFSFSKKKPDHPTWFNPFEIGLGWFGYSGKIPKNQPNPTRAL